MTKVKLPREVAEAIEEMRNDGKSNFNIMRQAEDAMVSPVYLTIRRWAFDGGGGTSDLLMQALVNGYEVEKTPEEKVREYYESFESCFAEHAHEYAGVRHGVRKTLEILGIKIGGINA